MYRINIDHWWVLCLIIRVKNKTKTLTLGPCPCIEAIFVRSAILLLIASNSAMPKAPFSSFWLSLQFGVCADALRFKPILIPLVYSGVGFFFLAPKSRGPFCGLWIGLTARVIEILGNWGRVVGIWCFWASAELGGDKGVLGGVGGWDGGVGCSFRGGPKVRFSKILPETIGKISKLGKLLQ